jgi:hypothetical protein
VLAVVLNFLPDEFLGLEAEIFDRLLLLRMSHLLIKVNFWSASDLRGLRWNSLQTDLWTLFKRLFNSMLLKSELRLMTAVKL